MRKSLYCLLRRKFLARSAPRSAPCGSPAFAKKRVVWNTVIFSVTGKNVIPDNTWNGNDDPIQRPEEQTLDRVSIFVGTHSADFLCIADTEKNEDAQRQPPAGPRQIGNDGVAEFFTVETGAAEQEYKQTGKVDR